MRQIQNARETLHLPGIEEKYPDKQAEHTVAPEKAELTSVTLSRAERQFGKLPL